MDDPRITQIQTLIEPILASRELELVELTCRPQSGQLLIRVLVDRVGGVTIGACAKANQEIGAALDLVQAIDGNYTVEVSSPGLDRPLVSQRDFERAIGEDLHIVLNAVDGRFKELDGMVLAVQPQAVVLKTSAGNLTVALSEIRMAKKAVRW